MPRSSRHKSSKHSSREVREYSDSEKDSGLKEKKGRDDGGSIGGGSSSRHLKESISGEKRKSDSKSVDISKDLIGGGVAVNADEFGASSSSKKRKEKEDDDRWTGGDNNEHDLSKSDSKRVSRREGSLVAGLDGEEGKRSGSKVDSKHHRSERKERGEKEGGSDRDRKGSKSERLVDGVADNENVSSEGNKKQGNGEDRSAKHGVGNSDCNIQEDVRNTDADDRRVRRKRDGSGDGDKHQDGVRELDDRRLSSKEDIIRSGKYKDEGHKDERTRDRYQEELDKENWHQDEKQRDNRATREYVSSRSEDKHPRNEKKDVDVSQKKSKPLGSEYYREPDRERDRDRDRDHDRDRGRDRDRDRERARHDRDRDRERDKEHDERDHDLDRDRDRDLDRSHERDREPDRDKERVRDRYHRDRDRDRGRDREHNHDRGRDRDYDHDQDYVSHVDDKVSRYKDDRSRRRSPEGYDDYHGDKSRRVESEVDKDRSLSRKAHVDSVTSSSRRRSPSSRAYINTDKYRDGIQDETKYGDSSRDGLTSETLDKVPKYRSGEKRTKFDENHIGEFSERSPSAKASPAGLKERSPSTSVDRRFQSRSGRRRSLDVDDTERRSCGSNDLRDASVNEDRHGREFSAKKQAGEDYPPPESPFHHKSNQGNMSSHVPGPSPFRTGADSPSYMGPLGEDTRGHSGNRYRRSVDPNVGRGPGNAWKGPNWPSPLPNGFMPFPPGPPGPHHGGFPPMLSQFPPLFGVRPSMDMNHPGMPYHMPDGDRFSGHVRPMGWQNMVDGSVPPHFHGWDASNGVLRDESSMYGSGHLANAQRRDMNAEMWKQNGDLNMDVTSVSQKDGHIVKSSMDEASSAQGASKLPVENSCLDEGTSHKMNTSSGPSSAKEVPTTPAKVTTEKTPESSSVDDTAHSVRAYLAKLDISIDMADPELYNQFINLAVKGQSEFVEEVELEYMQEKAVVEPEIANLTMGLTFFPAPKDSIFQKAMDLYNTHSSKQRFTVKPNGETLHSSSASELKVEQISAQVEESEPIFDHSSIKEEPSIVVSEVVSTATLEVEGKNSAILASDEALNGGPVQSAELAHDHIDQGPTPILTVEKVDEDMDLDKGLLSAENTYPNANATESNTETEVGNDGKSGGVAELITEQFDVDVSGPLVLSHDSVKACEPLISVSNESDSVILSRIHHAPESTH